MVKYGFREFCSKTEMIEKNGVGHLSNTRTFILLVVNIFRLPRRKMLNNI